MEDRGTKRTSAQSATELALFGAILVFVIGAIVRTGLSSSMLLNVNLRVLRMALRESYLTSEGAYKRVVFDAGRKWDKEGSNARNMASVVVLEDRLSVTPGSKIGTSDRIPFVSMASATMSRNLFRPIDFGEVNDIGLSDVLINGLRFPFATGGFKEVVLSNDDGSKPDWIPLCSAPHSQEKDDPPPYGLCWMSEGVSVLQCVDIDRKSVV